MRKKKVTEDFSKYRQPLDFLDTSSDNVSEDEILNYLAKIIADIYLEEQNSDSSEKTPL